MIGYSECAATPSCWGDGIESTLVITKDEIIGGGQEVTDPSDVNAKIQVPWSEKITVAKNSSCKLLVTLEDNTKDAKTGAFAAT